MIWVIFEIPIQSRIVSRNMLQENIRRRTRWPRPLRHRVQIHRCIRPGYPRRLSKSQRIELTIQLAHRSILIRRTIARITILNVWIREHQNCPRPRRRAPRSRLSSCLFRHWTQSQRPPHRPLHIARHQSLPHLLRRLLRPRLITRAIFKVILNKTIIRSN